MASSPQQDGKTRVEAPERDSGVLLLLLPLHAPSTMTLDRRVWRDAVREATRSYGEYRCIVLYLLLLGLGVGATAAAFVFLQWLLDATQYAWWAWAIGAAALAAGLVAVLLITKWLLKGPKRHLALVLEVRGIVLCGRCGYRIEGLDQAGRCPECGSERPLGVAAGGRVGRDGTAGEA
jgi:hypothetical protein